MEVRLVEGAGELIRFEAALTAAEADALVQELAGKQLFADLVESLASAICPLSRNDGEPADAADDPAGAWSGTLVYKGIEVSREGLGGVKNMERAALDALIARNPVRIDPDELEAEFERTYTGLAHSMRYEWYRTGNRSVLDDYLTDEMRQKVRADVLRDMQLDVILKAIIEQEGLSTTVGEREAEARRIAEQEHMDLDQAKRFLGDGYELLEGDLLRKKAIELVNAYAVIV